MMIAMMDRIQNLRPLRGIVSTPLLPVRTMDLTNAASTENTTAPPLLSVRGKIALRISQHNFSFNTMSLTLPQDEPIVRLQREIASRLHGDAVLPSNILIFPQRVHCKFTSPFLPRDVAEIPIPSDAHVIAQPEWKLKDCFPSLEPVGASHPEPLRPKSLKAIIGESGLGSSKSNVFLASLNQLFSTSSMNLRPPETHTDKGAVEVIYDVLPYIRILDSDSLVHMFYPRKERREVVDKSCSILMKDDHEKVHGRSRGLPPSILYLP
ncbi:hypothetical protein BC830DRAFT_948900 [Chytriomyces sp. MP71]|nr:hypothetical protein BC830DRAFT_948900 [Chytriomyces sp. MP71]